MGLFGFKRSGSAEIGRPAGLSGTARSNVMEALEHRTLLSSALLGEPAVTPLEGPIKSGPLRVNPKNPRYFMDGRGNLVYLAGAHTWGDTQDTRGGHTRSPFDFERYLRVAREKGYNYIRLWHDEQPRWSPDQHEFYIEQLPFQRSGGGVAKDGKPKFDLRKFDQSYFDRLRKRVVAARDAGIYVSVMLFQGWSIENKNFGGRPWDSHPFNAANNINGIDGDLNKNNQGEEVHTLANRAVTAIQEAYVRKVIDTVGDLDNVMFEISNESPAGAAYTAWQYHMINLIKDYQRGKKKRHPVIMSWPWKPAQSNADLFNSPADAIMPGWGGYFGNDREDYRFDPPAAHGRKVIIADTDHFWGVGGDASWVWKSFTRGLNPSFMDPYYDFDSNVKYKELRDSLGYTRTYAMKMELEEMTPRGDLTSTRYALADPGDEYLVYQPGSGEFTVNLSGVSGKLTSEWLNPVTGEAAAGAKVSGGSTVTFSAPFSGHAVLYLRAQGDALAKTGGGKKKAAGKAGKGDGLKAAYYDNRAFKGKPKRQIDPFVKLNRDSSEPLAVRWTGQIKADRSKRHTFTTKADGAVRLWINDRLVINDWKNHETARNRGRIKLEAGKMYDIRMEYYDRDGDGMAKLLWNGGAKTKAGLVPKRNLFSTVKIA